jgi:hypothetical protein
LGRIRERAPVKLFVGLLTSLPETIPLVSEQLSSLLGLVDLRSETLPFDTTHYYDQEMGSPLKRIFFGFEGLIRPDAIAGIKAETNKVEATLSAQFDRVSRAVNLDPGYLEQSKIVLASTKNFYHRIYLAEGIYGEVTLHYEGGRWLSFPWTFPDYKSGRYDTFFIELRKRYRLQLSEA